MLQGFFLVFFCISKARPHLLSVVKESAASGPRNVPQFCMSMGVSMMSEFHFWVNCSCNIHDVKCSFTRMEADPVRWMVSWALFTMAWKTGSSYSNLLPKTMADIMFDAALLIAWLLLKALPERQRATDLSSDGKCEVLGGWCFSGDNVTFILFKYFNQVVTFLDDSPFAKPFAHPELSQHGDSKTPHFFPRVAIGK